MQDVVRQMRDEAHVRPGKAIGRRRARDNWSGRTEPQVAGHVLARRWIVLRSCACHAATGLSTPVDKRVDVRAESVSGVRPGETTRETTRGAPKTVASMAS